MKSLYTIRMKILQDPLRISSSWKPRNLKGSKTMFPKSSKISKYKLCLKNSIQR